MYVIIKMVMDMGSAWTITFLILLFIELITDKMVSIWFVLGALSAIITSCFIDNILLEIIVFIVVSSISLFLIQRIIKGRKVNKG